MLKLSNLKSIGKPVYKFHNLHSVDFDGVDGFIQLGEAISYTQHTISTWVKVSDSDDSKTIIDARDASDDGVRIRVDASENIIYELNTRDLTSTNTFAGEWVHIVATYDGTTQKLYINGSLDKSAITSQTISTTTKAKIGSRNFSARANEFLGKIDELAIYDRALTAAEVTEIYRIKYGANLVQNGRFDELGSEILADGNFTNQEAVDFWSIATTDSESRATKSLQDGFMRLTYDLTNGSALFKSGIVTSGKSYRVTFRAKGTVTNNFGSIGDNANISSNPQYVVSNPNLTTSFQDYEFYVPVTSTTFRLYLNGSVTVGQTLDITNISIKQVDPNDRWTLGTGWAYGDGIASCDGTQSSSSDLNTTSGFSVQNNAVKVTFVLVRTAGTLSHATLEGTGQLDLTNLNSSGTYTFIATSSDATARLILRADADFIGSITNVMLEQQKYVATNLKLNSIPYSISNLRNYYRFGDGILDTFPFINDMIAPSLANISTTNLVTHSEDLSQWNKSNLTTTSGFTAPDGTNTAYKLTTTSDNENAGVYIDVTTVSGTTYVMSGFFKNQNVTGKTSFMARVSGGTLFRRSISFDGAIATTSTYASTGTVDGIQLFDKGNGWYRFSFYFVADGTTTQVEVDVDRENEAVGNAIYFWGAMLEEGFQASKYIKTEGSTVSRTATVENVYGTMTNMTEADITNDVPS